MRTGRRNFGFSGRLGFMSALLCSAVVFATPARAADTRVAYVAQNGSGYLGAYLVTWRDDGRATVVTYEGRSTGTVTVEGLNRVIRLGRPIATTVTGGALDSCTGGPADVRNDITHVAVRLRSGTDLSGLSAVSTQGARTILTGCEAGKVEPVGDITDTSGTPTLHRPFDGRPPIDDLAPGAVIAGMAPRLGDGSRFPEIDVAVLNESAVRFERTGAQVPLSRRADKWLMLNYGAPTQRSYTRITRADSFGIEHWMTAEWVDGVIARVDALPMFKVSGTASWASIASSSRKWQSGIFARNPSPFFIHLYSNGTGERVTRDTVTGQETRIPLSAWRLRNGVLEMDRTLPDGSLVRRFWVPKLRTTNAMGVIEREIQILPDSTRLIRIPPRVNWYIDTGSAG